MDRSGLVNWKIQQCACARQFTYATPQWTGDLPNREDLSAAAKLGDFEMGAANIPTEKNATHCDGARVTIVSLTRHRPAWGGHFRRQHTSKVDIRVTRQRGFLSDTVANDGTSV